MNSLKDIAALMEHALGKLSLPPEPALLYEPIHYTLQAGGKRIRPLLTLGCCALFSDDLQKALPAAMGIEVFHNFTLLHDDIMDNSSLRRGRDTVHVKWNPNVAILSGDAMLIYAYDLAAKSAPEKLSQIMPILNRTFMGVCEGQQYDMDFESRLDVSPDEYIRMIGLKTAVLMAGAMQIGAILGGADPAAAQCLYQAGMQLGTAFQLQDDLLDTYGDTAVWGKNIGDDIACNKKTFLLIKALEQAQGEDKERLHELLASTTIGREEKIEAVKAIYDKTGARKETEAHVERYFGEASAIIDQIPVEEARKEPLKKMAEALVGREK